MTRVSPELAQKALALLFGGDGSTPDIEEISLLDESILKSAYRKQALKFHPDRAGALGLDSSQLEEVFKRLHGAYRLVNRIASEDVKIDLPEPDPIVTPRGFHDPRNARADGEKRGERAGRTAGEAKGRPGAKGAGVHSRARPHGHDRTANRAGANDRTNNHRDDRPRGRDPKETPARNGPSSYHSYAPAGKGIYTGPLPRKPLRFAQFLYYAGIIDWQTMIDAITWQMHVRPKIGEIGRAYRFFDYDGIGEIIREREIGELFGTVALRLGKVSRLQLHAMIGKQRNLNLPIGRYFLEEQLFNRTQLETLLENNRAHNSYVRRPR